MPIYFYLKHVSPYSLKGQALFANVLISFHDISSFH